MGTRKLALASLMIAILLLLGAAPANAETTLCATGSPENALCGEGAGKKLSAAAIKLSSTNPQLTTSITGVSCKESAMTVEPGASTGVEAIAAEVTALSFANDCTTSSGTNCTVTVQNLPYPAAIESTGPGESDLRIEDPSGAGFLVKCGVLINCTFTTKAATLAGLNGSPTTFAVSGLSLERSGGFCPQTDSFHVTYSASEPGGFTVL